MRPIFLGDPEVKAVLSGGGVTLLRPIHRSLTSYFDEPRGRTDIEAGYPFVETQDGMISAVRLCPFGDVGDKLWVRETWQAIHVYVDPETGYGDDWCHSREVPKDDNRGWWSIAYREDWGDLHVEDRGFPWRPPISMPRWASRIVVEITGLTVRKNGSRWEWAITVGGVSVRKREGRLELVEKITENQKVSQ